MTVRFFFTHSLSQSVSLVVFILLCNCVLCIAPDNTVDVEAVVGEKTAEPAGASQLMLQIKKHATLRFAHNVRPNTGVSTSSCNGRQIDGWITCATHSSNERKSRTKTRTTLQGPSTAAY
jgi:hypothetical protein